jgi:hypothetical protein
MAIGDDRDEPVDNPRMTTTPKPRRRWYQFRLRTLLVLMVLASIGLSWFAVKMRKARRQREAVAAITKCGGMVRFDYGYRDSATQPPGPAWLRSLLGDDFFTDAIAVWIFSDDDAEALRGLPELQELSMDSDAISDAALAYLSGIPRLRELSLVDAQITDSGLANLGKTPLIQRLWLDNTALTDAGIEHLGGLTDLRYLSLINMQIGDGGLKQLEGLSRLETLRLSHTQVTDAGLLHLRGLTQLRMLDLLETKVSDQGVRELNTALPRCVIMH